MSGQVSAPTLSGTEMVAPAVVPSRPVTAPDEGASETPAPVGAEATTRPEPGPAQPYPCTAIPINGQVTSVAAAGTVTAF